MKIYTKTGDKGLTSLVGGKRVSKCDARLDAYGTIDELNSFVGLLVSSLPDGEDKCFLESIQKTLFDVGGLLALDEDTPASKYNLCLEPSEIDRIESEIDRISELLPPLKSFVIPGGTYESSLCHVCRTITRRAERCIYLVNEEFLVYPEVLIYINRLSDYFFVLSRYFNLKKEGEKNI